MANKDVQVLNQSDVPVFRDPFAEIGRIADRFFSDPFGDWMPELPQLSRRANTALRETDQGYVLSAEIPGIPKQDVEITVNGNTLDIRAEHREEEGDETSEGGYRRQYRSFRQSFTLPSTVDVDKIEAHCENGMLEVMIPKAASSQARRIEVKSGQGGVAIGTSEKAKPTEQKEKKH